MVILSNMLFCLCGSFILIRHLFCNNYEVNPNKTKQLLMDISYNSILYYSKLQIFIQKYVNKNKYISWFVQSIMNIFFTVPSYTIEAIKNNKATLIKNVYDLNLFDFIIYSHFVKSEDNSLMVNKCIHYEILINYEYKTCNYKFISMNILFSPIESYPIKLYSTNENYFIKNNRINKDFIFYYLNQQYGINKKRDEKYTLEIIDHFINIKFISEEEEILLGLDMYEIRPYISEDKKLYSVNNYSHNHILESAQGGIISDNIQFHCETEDEDDLKEEDEEEDEDDLEEEDDLEDEESADALETESVDKESDTDEDVKHGDHFETNEDDDISVISETKSATSEIQGTETEIGKEEEYVHDDDDEDEEYKKE